MYLIFKIDPFRVRLTFKVGQQAISHVKLLQVVTFQDPSFWWQRYTRTVHPPIMWAGLGRSWDRWPYWLTWCCDSNRSQYERNTLYLNEVFLSYKLSQTLISQVPQITQMGQIKSVTLKNCGYGWETRIQNLGGVSQVQWFKILHRVMSSRKSMRHSPPLGDIESMNEVGPKSTILP